MRNWRKTLKWTLYIGLGLALVGSAVYYVKTTILPYSLKYNRNGSLSTTPNGVADNNVDGSSSQTATAQVPRAVLLTPIINSVPASDTYDKPVEYRLDLLDTAGKVISKGANTTVTLSSSSPTGQFDVGTAVLLDTDNPSPIIKYRDTVAGHAKISAFVSGLVGSTADAAVNAADPVRLTAITPNVKSPALSIQQVYMVTLQDRFGNATTGGTVNWSVVSDVPALPYTFTNAVPVDNLGISHFSLVLPADRAGIPDVLSANFGSSNVNLRITPTAN
jgi:hypothetical protein